MLHIYNQFSQRLSQAAGAGRLRELRSITPGSGAQILVDRRPMINFASEDYLGLANHPLLKQRAVEYTQRFGAGSSSSRLLSGNIEPFEYVERKLASLMGSETALIIPSEFQANVTVLGALSGKNSLIAYDERSCASLVTGSRLNSEHQAQYKHNDFNDLAERLAGCSEHSESKWIVSESVFDADGDRCDLPSLLKVAAAHQAAVFLDETHAAGVIGELGMGVAAGNKAVTVAAGSFGKACGSFGYVACSRALKEYLINFAAGSIDSTALPPPVLGAIDAALDLVPTMEKMRQELSDKAERLRVRLNKLGFDTGLSSTQIVPIMLNDQTEAARLTDYLLDGGLFAPSARLAPQRQARLRLSLTCHHTREHLERLLLLLRNFRSH